MENRNLYGEVGKVYGVIEGHTVERQLYKVHQGGWYSGEGIWFARERLKTHKHPIENKSIL